MDYKKLYKKMIENAKSKCRVKSTEYFEKHHIIPDFMFLNRKRTGKPGHMLGNPNDACNIVLLTPREHFICHVLFHKIMKGTKYEYQAGSALIFFFNKFDAVHPRTKFSLKSKSKWYEKCRLAGISNISAARTGTMPVKDAITGIMIGSVQLAHPKVLAGDWVHHSKGRIVTASERASKKLETSGTKNPNYSGITDKQIYEFAQAYFIPRGYMDKKEFDTLCITNKIPVMRAASFRFGGNGFVGLITKLAKEFGSIPSKLNHPHLYYSRKLLYDSIHNKNFSGVTDDKIYTFARDFYINRKYMCGSDFGKACKLNNIPTLNKIGGYRFCEYDGGYYGLLVKLSLEFGELVTLKTNRKLYFLNKKEFNVKNNTN